MKKCIFLLVLCCGNLYAAQTPINLSTDSRVSVVAFSENNVVLVQGATFVATQIKFGSDESILNIQSGDAAAWTAKVDENLPNMLFLKPESYDSHTNMTVITNKHTYYFSINSNKKDREVDVPTYALKFIYPEEEKAEQTKRLMRLEKQKKASLSAFRHPKDYQWKYSFNGDTRVVPMHVFDDGEFTYFQLRPNQTMPAVFAVDNSEGNESLVNVRREGDYLIVQRVAPQFTLRSGEDVVASIFNEKMIGG